MAALSALLTVPWALKFLWAPAVDTLRGRGVPLRHVIVAAQLAMAASFAPLLVLPLPEAWAWLALVLTLHAFCAATQDVAIDALAVASIPTRERGATTGWMQAGMLTGRALFGGASLQVEAWLGPGPVIAGLVGLLVVSSALVARLRGEPAAPPARAGAARAFWRVLRAVLTRRATWQGVAFAGLAYAGMEAAGTVAGPLLVDRGFSEAAVGRFFALPAVAAMAAGALVGGRIVDRTRRRRGAAGALAALTATLLALAWAAWPPVSPALLVAALSAAYAVFGAFTAASYALFMDLTEDALGGTQFSTFMGAVNACTVWSGFAMGRLTGALDYPAALVAMAFVALPSLLLLPAMRPAHARARAVF